MDFSLTKSGLKALTFILVVVGGLASILAIAGGFTGKVVKVIDGDSIAVMHDGKADQPCEARSHGTDIDNVAVSLSQHRRQKSMHDVKAAKYGTAINSTASAGLISSVKRHVPTPAY